MGNVEDHGGLHLIGVPFLGRAELLTRRAFLGGGTHDLRHRLVCRWNASTHPRSLLPSGNGAWTPQGHRKSQRRASPCPRIVRHVHPGYDAAVTRSPSGWDVVSPVQAELFVVWYQGDHLELTGPCGAAPWLLELAVTDHPVEVVERIVRDVIGEPSLLHSTSGRRDREAVILSFVVVIDAAQVGAMESQPIARAELARSTATAAPRTAAPCTIAHRQVVEHGRPSSSTVCAAWPGSRTTPQWWSRNYGGRPHNMLPSRDEVLAMLLPGGKAAEQPAPETLRQA
jgi:hypothetical protein